MLGTLSEVGGSYPGCGSDQKVNRAKYVFAGTVTVCKYGHEIKRATSNKVWLDGVLQN